MAELSTSPNAIASHTPLCIFTGSSVCAGWHATQNYGWAQRLGDHLISQGWRVENVSKPGADARLTIDRFHNLVVPKAPNLVVIGLGLWNERINQRGRKAVLALLSGLLELVALCRAIGAHVVVGGVYPNQRYQNKEYMLLKETHEALQSWKEKFGIEVLDFLSNVDDGTGKWREGHYSDFIHPNDAGHEQLYANIDLKTFDSKKVRPLPHARL